MNALESTLRPEKQHTENFTMVFWDTLPEFTADHFEEGRTPPMVGRTGQRAEDPEMRRWRDAGVDAFWLTERGR
jgi:hypothetical protein